MKSELTLVENEGEAVNLGANGISCHKDKCHSWRGTIGDDDRNPLSHALGV